MSKVSSSVNSRWPLPPITDSVTPLHDADALMSKIYGYKSGLQNIQFQGGFRLIKSSTMACVLNLKKS